MSEVTAEVLEKVAKRLGRDYAVKKDLEGRPVILVRGNPAWRECSHGDLLLAILNKAAEMGYYFKLQVSKGVAVAACIDQDGPHEMQVSVGNCETPLAATMLAFAQLPESP